MAHRAAGLPPRNVLSASLLRAAEGGDAAATLSLFDEEGYRSIDARSLYQSTLMHTAAKQGHAELARRLLQRGADVNALDFGGMRRTPLHWACKGGHVAMVELLVAAGADTAADGPCWSKLVQGQRCGNLIPRSSPTESVESVCQTNAVRLALTQPPWEPSVHYMWPPRFKQAARLLLLASSSIPHGSRCKGSADASNIEDSSGGSSSAGSGGGGAAGCGSSAGSGGSAGAVLPLTPDVVLEVIRAAAYPISAWM